MTCPLQHIVFGALLQKGATFTHDFSHPLGFLRTTLSPLFLCYGLVEFFRCQLKKKKKHVQTHRPNSTSVAVTHLSISTINAYSPCPIAKNTSPRTYGVRFIRLNHCYLTYKKFLSASCTKNIYRSRYSVTALLLLTGNSDFPYVHYSSSPSYSNQLAIIRYIDSRLGGSDNLKT